MATFNTAFGSLSKDMKMQAGLPKLPGTQQLQAQVGAQQPQRPAPQQTFAAMQQQGMARPAPQPAPPPAQSQAFLGQLQQQVSQLRQAPSVYGAPQIQQMRQAQQAELEAQFGAQRQMLQEELARRGIADSTIAAGRFGDVAGQQARALASMEADLLTRAAEAQQQREQAITSALLAGAGEARAGELGAAGLTGMLGGAQTLAAQQQAEQARQFNLQQQLAETLGIGGLTGQVGATPTLEAQRLQQQAALEGRSLDIQEATAQANVNIRAQELQQQAAQFGQSLTLDQARLQAQQEQFAAEQQLAREREIGVIGGKESIAARALTESALARLSQEQLQQAQLTGEFRRDDGTVVSTLAAQQLEQDEYNAKVMQALQQSEATGLMYRVNDAGEVVLDADENGNPVSTEQRRAQMEQEKSTQIQDAIRKADLLSSQTGLSYTIDADGKVIADIDPATNKQRTTIQAQELQQRKTLAEAELTGQMTIDGKQVSTLAYKRLGEERMANALQQAAQQSQTTGNVYVVNDAGNVVPLMDANNNPVKTESALARLSQQALQEAELKGFFTDNTKSPPVQISTIAAKSLDNQQLEALTRRAALMSEMEGKVYEINDAGELVATDRNTEQVRASQAREAAAQRQNALLEARALSENSGLSWVLDGSGNVVRDIDPSTGQQRTTEQARQFGLELSAREQEAAARQQLANQGLLIQLAELMGGRFTDADFADLMSKLGLGKDGGGKDDTGTGVTGTGETGTETKKKIQPPPIDIFDPGYTPQGEIE